MVVVCRFSVVYEYNITGEKFFNIYYFTDEVLPLLKGLLISVFGNKP